MQICQSLTCMISSLSEIDFGNHINECSYEQQGVKYGAKFREKPLHHAL